MNSIRSALSWLSGVCALLLMVSGAFAQSSTSISNLPLATQTTGTARANLMVILDDSGSMGDDAMPDSADYNNRCFGYFGINTLAYNPAKTYSPPLNADGTPFANASFTAAKVDGYSSSSTTTNLSSAPISKNSESFYYTKPSGSTVPTSSNCGSSTNANAVLTRVTSLTAVSPRTTTAQEQQNYANWYSYYRTRILTTRAGVGRSFAGIDASRVRVGFTTIHDRGGYSGTSAADSAEFLNIRDFDSSASVTISGTSRTQKQWFYNKLYSLAPSGYTPLRPAVERAGRYFANKLTGQLDPIQYACQRNFAILATDGYWNTGDESTFRSSYVPQGVTSSTAIGDRDGTAPRPYFDVNKEGNTLADIAYYYYTTDLRTSTFGNCTGALGADVCDNTVVAIGRDTATHQHMVLYTIGLGLAGTLTYRPDYETATSGAYFNISRGTGSPSNWPSASPTSTSNTVVSRVDDLWHAAVNGRGYFYSANDSDQLADALDDALTIIGKDPGSAAAASTSSLKPVNGDDKIFLGKYLPADWSGKLESYTLNTTTGALQSATPNWEAGAVLTARTSSRNVYFFQGTATNKLASFTYSNLGTTQKTYFNGLCTSSLLSQCSSLTSNGRSRANAGADVVNYLTGTRTYEQSAAAADNQVFRTRASLLGDLGNASPVYVKKPKFSYTDSGYASFVTANASRAAAVYVAANDGMLHSFDASNGAENWAFVPSMVMPQMYRLADANYADGTNHRFYVDATPVAADVYDGSAWRTILVGGLGAGGSGYYALDVTDPANPKGLWEFTNTNLGLSYSTPVITKLKNGTWVAIFSSGYQNTTGDGNGHVYVVNAVTGALLYDIPTYTSGTTPAGTSGAPSNLGRLNAYVASETDNTALRVYGGDWLGNMWRFDIDDNIAPAGREAFLLAQARDASGAAQPITIKPTLSQTGLGAGSVNLVAFATGRYMRVADLTDTQTQSLYVIKDDLTSTALGNLRTNTSVVQQTLGADRKLVNPQAVDFTVKSGWRVDFDRSSKERVNIDMVQQFNTLAVASNIPTATPCSPGGTAWLYYFDLATGTVKQTTAFGTLIVGLTTVVVDTESSDGSTRVGKAVTIVTGGTGVLTAVDNPAASASSTVRRTSWRELVN